MRLFTVFLLLAGTDLSHTHAYYRAPSSTKNLELFIEDPISQTRRALPMESEAIGKALQQASPDPRTLSTLIEEFIHENEQALFERPHASNTPWLKLQPLNVTKMSGLTIFRFQQVLPFTLKGTRWFLPVEGGEARLSWSDQGLSPTLTLRLFRQIPPSANSFRGFSFQLSNYELARFFHYLKLSPEVGEQIHRLVFPKFNDTEFRAFYLPLLISTVENQRLTLNTHLQNLSEIQTFELLKSLIDRNKIRWQWHRQKAQWFFDLNELFDLPISLWLEPHPQAALTAFSLRENVNSVLSIKSWENPNYPPMSAFERLSPSQNKLILVFKDVFHYFSNLGWNESSEAQKDLEFLTQVKGARFRENAYWNQKLSKFIIGAGGDQISNLDASLGVLGHEYSHTIIQKTSGLIYQGESGAINEHFADLEGASIEAESLHNGSFEYALDGLVLTPLAQEKRSQLLKLSLSSNKSFKDEDKLFYQLSKPKLRHFFAPTLSYMTQFDDYKKGLDYFGVDCVPSVENDNCGVHSLSGILNKASSLIIKQLGYKETRLLFFKTATLRLGSHASFQDYRRALYEECLTQPDLKNNCLIINDSFAAVGIEDQEPPPFSTSNPLVPSPPQGLNADFKNEGARGLTLETEPLKFCGWMEKRQHGYIRIIDGKYDVVLSLLESDFPRLEIPSTAEASAYRNSLLQPILKNDCGCLVARIQNKVLNPDRMISRLENVVSLLQRVIIKDSKICAAEPKLNTARENWLKDLLFNDFLKDRNQTSKIYCGWVSVHPKSKNITIIDNRFDVAILQSGYPVDSLTQGFTKEAETKLTQSQCGCIKGVIGQIQNSKGTLFNYLKEIDNRSGDLGVLRRPDQACVGLDWR